LNFLGDRRFEKNSFISTLPGSSQANNVELQADFYADDIEFYHDQGGLTTSKKEILESIRRNICGKVTRVLV
jgi:hypothetical protein